MVRPPRSSLPEEDMEDEEEQYYGEDFTPHHDSSTHRGEAGKLDGKRGSGMSSHRSKHSETEQRRRSKINERFQALRDLIPQNDQKRDKASLLLEVIEYIHFLQQRLQVYEGPYEGYNQEATAKLTPWRNNSGIVDSLVEPAQVMRNGTSHGNNVDVNLGMLTAAKDSLQPEIENGAVPLQMQSDMLATFGRGDLSGAAQLPLPNNVGDLVSHPQPQWWPAVPFAADYTVPNNLRNQHEELDIKNGSENISSAYSQGVLSSLTRALRDSGVDMSQASVSVQINVGKRTGSGATGTSSSKVSGDLQPSSQVATLGGDDVESDGQPCKKLRTENS